MCRRRDKRRDKWKGLNIVIQKFFCFFQLALCSGIEGREKGDGGGDRKRGTLEFRVNLILHITQF